MAKIDFKPDVPARIDFEREAKPKAPPISSVVEEAIRRQLGSQEPLLRAGIKYGPQALYGAAEPIRNIENILGAHLPDYPIPQGIGERIARGLGTGATSMAMVPTGAEEALMPFLAKSAAQGAIAGGLGGSEPRITNALAGAMGSAALAGMPEVAGASLRGIGGLAERAAARGERLLGLRTPEEVARISSQLEGKKVPLQNILLEPSVDPVLKAGQDKANEIVKSSLGETPSSSIYERLRNMVSNKKNVLVNKYNQLFNGLSERAKELSGEDKTPVDLQKYSQKLDAMKQAQPDVADFLDPKIKELSKKLEKAPTKKVSFDQAHKLQSALGKESAKSPELAREYSTLKNAVLDDIGETYNNLDPDLHSEYLATRRGYRREYVPYTKTSINNILKEKKASNLIGNELLQSHNSTILDDLGDEGKKLLTAHKLINHITSSDAGNPIDPARFLASYDRLRPDIKESISNPEIDGKVRDLRNILMAYRPVTQTPTVLPIGRMVRGVSEAVGKHVLGAPFIREAYAAGGAPEATRALTPALSRNALMALLSNQDGSNE